MSVSDIRSNSGSKPIRVLVVEDSPVVRQFLVHVLDADPAIEVTGTAEDGLQALEAVRRWRPDVITMDIHMPRMDGLEATRHIMETMPTPIIIVSGSWNPQEVATTFKAMEAGALTLLPRPQGLGHPDYEATTRELVQTVKLMSEVKVVRRWPKKKSLKPAAPAARTEAVAAPGTIRMVVVGASTGGPTVLHLLLAGLPREFPVPILIVQHMAAGFTEGFVDWLGRAADFPVHIAAAGQYPLPGHAYVAPDHRHLGIDAYGRIVLSREEPENGLRPSVSYLFRSVARIFGNRAVGILLTGMGRDGSQELKLLREAGAATFAQDEESSVVFGMPGEAVRLEAASYVLPPEGIAATLLELTRERAKEISN